MAAQQQPPAQTEMNEASSKKRGLFGFNRKKDKKSEEDDSQAQLSISTTADSSAPPETSPTTTLKTPTLTSRPSSFAQKTYEDARHFAGGIIARPFESTKHYSIVRHSHGLVFYSGTSTSLAITIFADEPLPADRTFWLQKKGFTGKAGMKAKALVGITGSWFNVTPSHTVGVEQLNPSDERAWQRDIARFAKKAPKKIRERHQPKETVIVHIPTEAGDGYFHILLCSGDKNVLCTSPTFRVLSTSASPSKIRGAGIGSLPLEFGAMAITTYTKATVGKVFLPVRLVVDADVGKYLPHHWVTKKVTHAALGAGDKMILDQNKKYDAQGELLSAEKVEAALGEGPQAPYPIRFMAKSNCNTSNMVEELALPNFSLNEIDDHVMDLLHGYYFGWARKIEKKSKDEKSWCQAILSVTMIDVAQLARVKVGQKALKSTSIRLLEEPDLPPADKEKWEVQVLGIIRPDEPIQKAELEKGLENGDENAEEAALITETNDVSVAEEILNHPSWTVEAASRPKPVAKTSGIHKITQGYASTKSAAQKQIGKVDLHSIGVRLDADKAREKSIAMNGFYVIRG